MCSWSSGSQHLPFAGVSTCKTTQESKIRYYLRYFREDLQPYDVRERFAPRGPKRVMLIKCVQSEMCKWWAQQCREMEMGSFILPDMTEGFSEEVTMKLGFEVQLGIQETENGQKGFLTRDEQQGDQGAWGLLWAPCGPNSSTTNRRSLFLRQIDGIFNMCPKV